MKAYKYSRDILAVAASLALLGACAKEGIDSSATKSGTSTSTEADKGESKTSTGSGTGTDTSTASSTSTGTGTAANTTTGTATEAAATGTASAPAASEISAAGSAAPATDPTQLLNIPQTTIAANPGGQPPASAPPAGAPNGKVNVNLQDLPPDVPICSVAKTEIKVADYRRTLRLQQIKANQTIVSNPQAKAKLLEEAKRLGITLNDMEKAKLVESAKQQKGKDPKQFQEYLKQAKTTEKQFDEEIMLTGLAFKTSNYLIEQGLLPDLVNRALFCQAAREAGAEKAALAQYQQIKSSKNYSDLLKQSTLSDAEFKTELVNDALVNFQMNKIAAQTKAKEADIKKLFDANKKQLHHGERIRLSTILIACPEKTVGPILSVRDQLKAANPKATDKELDAAENSYLEQAKQKALLVLGTAKGGGDFAKLSSENTSDPQLKKAGGDLGFLEKEAIIKPLAEVVWKLKAGEVLPQIVKSELGYNIYKVTAREPAGDIKYAEVRPKLEELVKQAQAQQDIAAWLNKKRSAVKVEFTPKFLAIANGAAAKQQ